MTGCAEPDLQLRDLTPCRRDGLDAYCATFDIVLPLRNTPLASQSNSTGAAVSARDDAHAKICAQHDAAFITLAPALCGPAGFAYLFMRPTVGVLLYALPVALAAWALAWFVEVSCRAVKGAKRANRNKRE